MSQFKYGPINFSYVRMATCEQSVMYDPTDTDQTYMKFHLEIDGWILPGDLAGVPGITPGMSPTSIVAVIRHILGKPRQPLLYSNGGDPLLKVDGIDDANGPKPRGIPIVTPITLNSIQIQFSVDVMLVDCTPGSRTVREYASNRFTLQHDIDHKGYSTLRTTGKILTYSSLLATGGPDSLRWLVTPAPRAGFYRQSSYTVQADGLAMDYSITDTEKYLMPPQDCVEASGKFSISTQNGGKYYAECSVHLEGKKTYSKERLMQTAIAICLTKISAARFDPVNPGKPYGVLAGAMSESLYENSVDVMLRSQINSPGSNQAVKTTTQTAVATGAAILGGIAGIGLGPQGAIAGAAIANNIVSSAQGSGDAAAVGKTINFDGAKFGVPPIGSSIDVPNILDPGLKGYLPLLDLLVASFRDPCLTEYTSVLRNQAASASSPIASAANSKTSTLNAQAKTESQSQVNQATSPMAVGNSFGTAAINVSQSLPNVLGTVPSAIINDDPGVWDYFYCTMTYMNVSGRVMMVGTKEGADCAFPQVSAPHNELRVRWTSSKIGFEPNDPPAESADTNLVYLDGTIGLDQVDVPGDGATPIFSHTGEYRYGVIDWTKVNRVSPVPPWLNFTQSQLSNFAADDDPDITAGTLATSSLSAVPNPLPQVKP